MKQNSKKILVIANNPFSDKFNNGKTLEAIFSWANPKSLAQLYFHSGYIPDYNFIKQYFLVSDVHVIKNCFGYNIQGIQQNLSNAKDNNTPKRSITKTIKTPFFRYMREYIWMLGFRKKKRRKLYNWISLFQPDFIFFVAGDFGFAHHLSIDISKLFNIPLYTYFTDDYVINAQPVSIFEKLHHRFIKRYTHNTIKISTKCFAIGEKMAVAYSINYSKDFYPIMNLIDVPLNISPQLVSDQNFRINYFGNVGLGRWEMIVRIAKICQSDSYLKDKIVFNVYTFDASEIFISGKDKIPSNITIHDGVIGEEYQKAKNHSSFLLHVESDNTKLTSKTKLSVSTKIPEYLCSGKPILAYGPKDIASMQLLYENNIGFFLDSNMNHDLLVESLAQLVDSYQTQKNILEERISAGIEFSRKYFNREQVINEFSKLFN